VRLVKDGVYPLDWGSENEMVLSSDYSRSAQCAALIAPYRLMAEVFSEDIGKHARFARQLISPEPAKRAVTLNNTCMRRDRGATWRGRVGGTSIAQGNSSTRRR